MRKRLRFGADAVAAPAASCAARRAIRNESQGLPESSVAWVASPMANRGWIRILFFFFVRPAVQLILASFSPPLLSKIPPREFSISWHKRCFTEALDVSFRRMFSLQLEKHCSSTLCSYDYLQYDSFKHQRHGRLRSGLTQTNL